MSKLDIDNMFGNNTSDYDKYNFADCDYDDDYGHSGGSSSSSKNDDNDGWKDDYISNIPKDINTYQDQHLKGELSAYDIFNMALDILNKY